MSDPTETPAVRGCRACVFWVSPDGLTGRCVAPLPWWSSDVGRPPRVTRGDDGANCDAMIPRNNARNGVHH